MTFLHLPQILLESPVNRRSSSRPDPLVFRVAEPLRMRDAGALSLQHIGGKLPACWGPTGLTAETVGVALPLREALQVSLTEMTNTLQRTRQGR